MTSYTPTYGAWETVKNVISFLINNFNIFWSVTQNYLGYILVLSAIQVGAQSIPLEGMPYLAVLSIPSQLLLSWVYICILISWHRVVIRGTHADLVNPIKPNKNDLRFLGLSIALPMLPSLGAIVFVVIGSLTGQTLLAILAIPTFCYLLYVTTRCMAALPANAIGEPITIKESYLMMSGYFWKIILSGLIMFAIIIVPYLIFMLLYAFLAGVIITTLSMGSEALSAVAIFIVTLPLTLLILPLAHCIGATFLSNYYMHARGEAKKSSIS